MESVTEPVPVPDLVTVKVNMGSTRVECEELLLVMSGSGSVAETFALFVAVPGELGTTMTEAVMLSPETSFSREQVRTRLDCWQVPWVFEEETKVTPAGSVSFRVKFVASLGPELIA